MQKKFLINFMFNPTKNKNINRHMKIGGTKFENDWIKILALKNVLLKYYPTIGSKINKLITLLELIFVLLTTSKTLYIFIYPLFYWDFKNNKIISFYQRILYKFMEMSRNKIAIVISDLDFVRNEGIGSIKKDIYFLKKVDYIIVHNENMAKLLEDNGIEKQRIINQEIGNNLSDYKLEIKRSLSKTVIFSGNLSKSRFLDKLLEVNYLSYTINLYGIGFSRKKETSFLKYKGSYSSEDIVTVIEGSWGLIWDGDDIEKCSGFYGEYTRINNPSKFSQYIAAGLPVIAWNKAAVADIIKKYKIGFVVDNLIEIGDMLNIITEKEYQEYINNVLKLREKVVTGYHFKRAIGKVIDFAEEDNKKTK